MERENLPRPSTVKAAIIISNRLSKNISKY
jgi:hypothetical protein